MAHFYGTLQGSRGTATRLGTEKSGMQVSAQSWDGSVIVKLWQNSNDETWCTIYYAEGSSSGGEHILWESPLSWLSRNISFEVA